MLNVKLDPEKVYKAIREGVEDAMWRMIRSATDMPGDDFYYFVKEGVKEAIEKIAE